MRGHATIRFELPVNSVATLRLYDVRGNLVQVAYDQVSLEAGVHVWDWDGNDRKGMKVSPGISFVTLSTPQHIEGSKVVVLE